MQTRFADAVVDGTAPVWQPLLAEHFERLTSAIEPFEQEYELHAVIKQGGAAAVETYAAGFVNLTGDVGLYDLLPVRDAEGGAPYRSDEGATFRELGTRHAAVHEEAGAGRELVAVNSANTREPCAEMDRVSSAVEDLNAAVDDVGNIVDVGAGIAEQTNLQALDAAIEAARAGEQGRGFRVVADKVRAVANRTRHSTTEIGTLIGQLRAGAVDSVEQIRGARLHVERSATEAGRMASRFGGIQQRISRLAEETRSSRPRSRSRAAWREGPRGRCATCSRWPRRVGAAARSRAPPASDCASSPADCAA